MTERWELGWRNREESTLREFQLEDGIGNGSISFEEGLKLLRSGKVALNPRVRLSDNPTAVEYELWSRSGTLVYSELRRAGASEETIREYGEAMAEQIRIQYPGVLDD